MNKSESHSFRMLQERLLSMMKEAERLGAKLRETDPEGAERQFGMRDGLYTAAIELEALLDELVTHD